MDEDNLDVESVTIRLRAPRDFVERIDERAGEELISRSAWIRRELVARLRKSSEGQAA